MSNEKEMYLTRYQHQSQQLLLHALTRVKDAEGPADENALDVSSCTPRALDHQLILMLDVGSLLRDCAI